MKQREKQVSSPWSLPLSIARTGERVVQLAHDLKALASSEKAISNFANFNATLISLMNESFGPRSYLAWRSLASGDEIKVKWCTKTDGGERGQGGEDDRWVAFQGTQVDRTVD